MIVTISSSQQKVHNFWSSLSIGIVDSIEKFVEHTIDEDKKAKKNVQNGLSLCFALMLNPPLNQMVVGSKVQKENNHHKHSVYVTPNTVGYFEDKKI